jgi:hypothetical protein
MLHAPHLLGGPTPVRHPGYEPKESSPSAAPGSPCCSIRRQCRGNATVRRRVQLHPIVQTGRARCDCWGRRYAARDRHQRKLWHAAPQHSRERRHKLRRSSHPLYSCGHRRGILFRIRLLLAKFLFHEDAAGFRRVAVCRSRTCAYSQRSTNISDVGQHCIFVPTHNSLILSTTQVVQLSFTLAELTPKHAFATSTRSHGELWLSDPGTRVERGRNLVRGEFVVFRPRLNPSKVEESAKNIRLSEQSLPSDTRDFMEKS